MRVDHIYDHHNAVTAWSQRDLKDWLTGVFEVPAIKTTGRCKAPLRAHVRREFQSAGWAINPKIDQELGLSVFAQNDDLAFQLQTGNVSRVAYDLLKLQHLYHSGKIEAASLAVPTKLCALRFGSNIANAERLTQELELFSRVITVPLMIIAIE